jgi:hypothetical protein
VSLCGVVIWVSRILADYRWLLPSRAGFDSLGAYLECYTLTMGDFWHRVFKGPSKLFAAMATALFWQRFNLTLTFFWMLLLVVSLVTGWVNSTAFISVLSIVALILASQSSWQASRVERKQDDQSPSSDAEDGS